MSIESKRYVRIEGSDSKIRKLVSKMDGRLYLLIRDTKTRVYAVLPENELRWLDKTVADFGCSKYEVSELPSYQTALCGAKVTHLIPHSASCKKCRAIRDSGKQQDNNGSKKEVVHGANRSSKTEVFRIEPGQDFNIDGIITSLEATSLRMMEELEKLDTLARLLREYKESSSKLAELRKEAKDRMEAAKKLLSGIV